MTSLSLTAGTTLASITRTLPVDGADLSLVDLLGPDGFAWLREGAGFVTSGVAARVRLAPGPDRFDAAASEVAALLAGVQSDNPLGRPGTGPVAVGALPFEDHLPGELVVPARVLGINEDGQVWVTDTFLPGGTGAAALPPLHAGAPPRANGHTSVVIRQNPGPEAWTAAVRRVLAGIGAGDFRKVVLAREVVVETSTPFRRADVLEHLRRSHSSCFTYASGAFVGASPELLVARRGDVVTSRPMAGSVRRGADRAEDDRLAVGLHSSDKEAEEHRLLVDAVVAALAMACTTEPSADPAEVVRLPTVSHLTTEVRGHLRLPAPSALALAGLLHPTPAVGGLPRRAALAAIAELEGFARGLYAGPVGWVDAAGDGEWAVALRGATLDGNRARLAAGAGIVAGSDPDAEWQETETKLAPMLAALGVAQA